MVYVRLGCSAGERVDALWRPSEDCLFMRVLKAVKYF